jgi:dTDP-glucose pyrophosphorylase
LAYKKYTNAWAWYSRRIKSVFSVAKKISMKIVIPMAGRGSRFQLAAKENPEYKKPKPLILANGEPMIVWALKSLPFVNLPTRPAKTSFVVYPRDLIFISLQEQETNYGITKLLKDIFGKDITVLHIQQVTRGAVETALTAKDFMTDEELIISDSDHFFDGTALYEAIKNKDKDTKGIIPTFHVEDKDPKWSYTLFDKDKTAIAVGEKDVELAKRGAFANIGSYYFSEGSIFRKEAEEMVEKAEMYGPEGKQEFYVAPVYQRLITKGMKIKAAVIAQVWGLGTPKDLEYFLENYKKEATSLG